ncbi:MAG: tetratricopeptide repeat protein [Myxococcota bacterium]|nr:tetratricopeptide repeat protein [Myxococcota bacterium]
MAISRASTIRPTTWWGTGQAAVLFAVFWAVSATLVGEWVRGLGVAALAFATYRLIIVRMLICRHHRAGVALTRAGRFSEAVQAFRSSAAFWQRWAWLDRSRGLLLGTSVAYPFCHLGRYNQAYCYRRMGRDEEARDVLQALVRDAPQMDIAQALLESLDHRGPDPTPPQGDETWGGMLGEE